MNGDIISDSKRFSQESLEFLGAGFSKDFHSLEFEMIIRERNYLILIDSIVLCISFSKIRVPSQAKSLVINA